MSEKQSTANDANGVDAIRGALKSQLHAGLAMLRLAIERCPDDLWTNDAYPNSFWRIAYHTLYYTHLYTQVTAADFQPWEHHQTSIQDMDDRPSPPEIMDLIELSHRPPRTGEPYTKAKILSYWSLCDEMIDGNIDAVDLLSTESGFSWYRIPKVEHLLVALRHLQHHTAQLGARLRDTSEGNNGVDWVGAGRHAKRAQFPLS